MKHQYAAMVISFAMSAALLGGCSWNNADEKEIYGEIIEIEEDQITIEVGTMKAEDEKPPLTLELCGETKTIEVTEDTVMNRQGMGEHQVENK